MKTINIQYITINNIDLILGAYEGKLCLLDYRYRVKRDTVDKRIQKALKSQYKEQNDEVIQKTVVQLQEYLENKREEFDIPLLLVGSDFQKSVWQALTKIPYGKTRTYKQQSITIGNEKAVRAVANANGANAIAIIVPCHRIIGTNGKLTGYAGGLETKQLLLDVEGKGIQ
jgi:methylated-DNA-[protein]-cysteine S-methyltransferase